MQKFSVGKANVTRIEETYLAVYDPKELFSEFTDDICREHLHWMAPHHYDPVSAKIYLSVHSWLLQIGDKKILSTLCPGGKERMNTLMSLVQTGRLDLSKLISHRFTLDQIEEAYDLFANQRDGVAKVAITP